MAESVVPNTSLSAASEPAFDIVCQPCSSEGKHVEAEGYCIDCCEHLCVHCIGVHKKYAGLKHHLLLDKAEMPKKQDTSQVRDVCTERCQIHRDKIIEYFCPIHKVLGCSVCITLKHSRCDNVIYIPEVAQGMVDSRDFTEFMCKLNGLIQKSKDTTKFAEESKTRASDYHDKATQKVDTYRQELVDAIDKQVQELKDRAKQIHSKDTGKMNALADDSNKVLAELQSMSSDLGILQNKKQFCQMFVEIKNKEQKLTELQSKLEDLDGDVVSGYDFQPDEQVPTMIRRTNGLGRLAMSSKKPDSMQKGTPGYLSQFTHESLPRDNYGSLLQTKAKIEANGSRPSVTVQDLKQRKATYASEIKVKTTGDDKECNISGITLLSSDRLIAADYRNGTVKLIDIPKKKIISKLKLETSAWDVTLCGDEVAATLTDVMKIVFLKCDNGIVRVREVSVNGRCRGIDFVDDKLFVIYDTEKKLEVMTVTGTVLQKFEKNVHGTLLFKDPAYVTVSAANQSIYVSEWREGRLTVLGLDGKMKMEYKDDELVLPKQLAADSAGVMYLCDNKKKIHLLSPTCQKVKVLLSLDDSKLIPRSVYYCESMGMLYIGMWNSDHIKIYQVS